MKLKIMKSVDEIIFEGIESLKSSPNYKKIVESFSNSEESTQQLIKTGLMILTLLIPIIIISIMFFISNSSQKKLDINNQIITTTSKILSHKSEIRSLSRTVFGNPINTKNQFSSTISNSLSRVGIDSNKVLISNFNIEPNNNFTELSADLKFNGFSSENLYSFLDVIVLRNKIKIYEIEIKKNTKTNLLDGLLSVIYYGKDKSGN